MSEGITSADQYEFLRRSASRISTLCLICLAFAFTCVFLKITPQPELLNFIVWIVGLTFAALMGRDGIELLKPKASP